MSDYHKQIGNLNRKLFFKFSNIKVVPDEKQDEKTIEEFVDYSISKRKKKKSDLIEHIVIFETNEENLPLVLQRQKMWEYIKVIKADKYLSKFLILD